MSEMPSPHKQDTEPAASATNVSGGVTIDAEQVNIDGDVVGRDKTTTNIDTGGGANIAGNVTVSPGSAFVGRDWVVNIRQILLNPWAWIGGIVILVIGLIIVAGVSNISSLQTLLPSPTPSPTPLAFAPTTEGQSLIIVADFEDRSGGKYQGIDPAQYVYEKLRTQVQQEYV